MLNFSGSANSLAEFYIRYLPNCALVNLKGNKVVLALLLLIPVILNLWVTLYNIPTPSALGLPFFWWFQIILLPVAAVFYIAYAFLAGDEA